MRLLLFSRSLVCCSAQEFSVFKTVAWIVEWSRCSTTQAVIFLILREKLQSLVKDNRLIANVCMQCLVN